VLDKGKTRASHFFREDRGSASVEFVALAIPLFIPLFIYINSFSAMSNGQSALRTLSREVARGFVTSSNDQIAYGVAQEILIQGGRALGFQSAIEDGSLKMKINCSDRPCISPDASVQIVMTLHLENGNTTKASSIEYVSPWV
jgi:Flp pilus assembly protein TadG